MNAAARIIIFIVFLTFGAAVYSGEFFFPFYIYHDMNSQENHGSPSGWLGDYRDIILNLSCTESPFSGENCMEITYTAEGSKFAYWAGMLWQNPSNNAGDIDAGIDLSGAKKLVFWARGDEGGEIVDAFKLGGTLGAYPDTDCAGIYRIMLNKEWTKYEIDLTKCDLSYISGLFCWVANRYNNPEGFKFYLDEIKIINHD